MRAWERHLGGRLVRVNGGAGAGGEAGEKARGKLRPVGHRHGAPAEHRLHVRSQNRSALARQWAGPVVGPDAQIMKRLGGLSKKDEEVRVRHPAAVVGI